MLSIQLPPKYQYLQLVLVVLGLTIGVIGMFGAPFLQSKLREDDVKELTEKVREWEPVIKGQLSIREQTLDSAYNKTIKWLESVGADIHKQDSPTYVLAFHETYDTNFRGLEYSSKVENWEKFFEISLTEAEGNVWITMEIHQGWLRTSLDRFKNRKRIWPRFVEDYSIYSGAVIESIDGTSQTTVDESIISELYKLRGTFLFLGILLIAVYIMGPDILSVNSALIVIGLVFILGLYASYRAAKS